MPYEYTKLAEGIVKGSVPMVASFVERYVSEDEPGFFVGDREHIEDSIRVHVTLFAYLDQPDSRMPESSQLGVVDLQQLPDDRVWMVVGGLPAVLETEGWVNDVYSAMVRRMAARLVQFGFLDAPNRPRLRAASTWALSQVAQVLRPQVGEPLGRPAPEPASEPVRPVAQAVPQAAEPVRPVSPPVATATEAPVAQSAGASPAAQSVSSRAVSSSAPLASTPPLEADLFRSIPAPKLDVMLTVALAVIWLAACGALSYLLVLLFK